MGDPKRIRKKFETPVHPWVGSRIATEKKLIYDYGLRNKTEVWRMDTILKRFKDRAKKLLAQSGNQAMVEQQQLLQRMARLGLTKQGASFDDILGLPIEAVMERRLQSILIKKHLARTPKQARQMITHRHVTVGGKVITSPGYLVTIEEEGQIGFTPRSKFVSEAHPERLSEEELARKRAKEEAKQQKDKGEGEDAATFDEKAIEQAEVLAGEKKVDSVKDAVKEEEKKEEPATEKKDEKEAPETPKETEPAKEEKVGEKTTEKPDTPEEPEKPVEPEDTPEEGDK